MKKNTITMLLLMTISACTSIAQRSLLEPHLEQNSETSSVCRNAQELANSLRIQELNLEGVTETELLDSLDIKILQNHDLHLVGARRISGECLDHLDEFRTSILHFDTDITLRINQDHISTYQIKPDPRNFINANDAHPAIPSRHFIQAIDTGGGHMSKDSMTQFIGVWVKNEKYIITPYKKQTSGAFYVYNDLLELENTVISIRFMHHLHAPSGIIYLALRDGTDIILINFTWSYWKLFSDEMD